MALTCWKIGVCWDALSCDQGIDFSAIEAPVVTVHVLNGETNAAQPVQDPDTGAELLTSVNVDWDPATGCLCTSELPSNIGTDATTHLNPAGTIYRLKVDIDGKHRRWDFQLDADIDYTSVADANGCVPVHELTFDVPAGLDTNLLDERVCNLTCITDISTQVDQNTLDIEAIQAAPDETVVTVIDDFTGSVTDGANNTGTFISQLNKNTGPLGVAAPLDPAVDVLITDGNVATNASYAASNAGGSEPNDGLTVGKADDGTLRQQPPLVGYQRSTAEGLVAFDGSDVDALDGQTIHSLCTSFTNESSWPLMLSGSFRTLVQMVMGPGVRNDWFMVANSSTGPAHTAAGSWSGSGLARREVCATNNCPTADSRQIIETFSGIADPGETVELCFDVVFNAVTYNPTEQNRVVLGATSLRVSGTPIQQIG